MIHKFYVVTSRGLVPQLEAELGELGAGSVRSEGAGCRVRGPLEFAYRICLWSRCANRVLLPLREVTAGSADELHRAIAEIAWEDHVSPEGTIAVDFTGRGEGITHTGFGAQRVKDGVVDRLRARFGTRPSVDRDEPDLRINVHARGRGYAVSLDLSGASLHRRGYREAAGPAPLKETLAAALLRFSKWNPRAEPLVDPMCGSGTILIEAALMAADVAPGLLREQFGFERWLGHDSGAWERLKSEARERSEARTAQGAPPIVGFDHNGRILEAARANAERAGVGDWVSWERATLEEVPVSDGEVGRVVTNPPYGTRMGTKEESRALLTALGATLRRSFSGWSTTAIVPDDHSMSAVGLPATRTQRVDNGPLEARFATFEVSSERAGESTADSAVVNRMRKNLKRLRRWANRNDVTCYRLYDADIPEYNAAVDIYDGHVHVQEYEAPRTIDPDVAAARLTAVTAAASEVLGIPASGVHVKVRRQQRGSAQYDRQGEEGRFFEVTEGGHRFLVNLSDYLDTGLFLDHRQTRALVAQAAKGTRFLNLFCYTGSFTVYAAGGWASSSVSVDLSNTYLDWTRRNLELNGIDVKQHRLVRADCLAWLAGTDQQFDLAVVDPPTFSNSKAMEGTFDVLRDHASLLEAVMKRIVPRGIVFFSTNARRFRLAAAVTEHFEVEDITAKTVPEDFKRGRPPHRCWTIRHRAS